MKKIKLTTTILALSLCSQLSMADFTWTVASTDRMYDSTGSTLLTGGTSASVGFFVELIYAGSNDVIDFGSQDGSGNYEIDPSNTTGVWGDDVRVATTYVGYGTPPFGTDARQGFFDVQTPVYLTGGAADRNFYIRAWEATSPDLTTSPVNLTMDAVNFGVSGLISDDGLGGTLDGEGNTIPNDGHIFSGFDATLSAIAIPEPGTLALFGLGGFALWNLQRRKRNQAKS